MAYYTAFLYEGKTPKELHCTHKFLGNIPASEVIEVIKVIDEYFAHKPRTFPLIRFDMTEVFAKSVRVLTPSYSGIKILPGLRGYLDCFSRDQYDGYRPHVTCGLAVVDEPFSSYALIGPGGIIVKEWKPR